MSRVRGSRSAFGTVLRRHRLAARWTQEQLAERAQTSVRTIRNLERGVTAPREATAWLLADAFGIPQAERDTFLATAADASQVRPALPTAGASPRHAPHAFPSTYIGGAPRPSSLSLPPTPLLGRDAELAHATAALRSGHIRLLTVTGPPGVGKTRLALEAAHLLNREMPDGAVFVPLAPLADARQVPVEIAAALAVEEEISAGVDHAGTPGELLIRHIGARRLLLVLDNFEHLMAAAPLVAQLLAHCTHLALLVTSRVALNLRGEHELPLRPLPLPDAGDEASLERLRQVASVQLLLQHAQAIQPQFALTTANSAAVAEICRRLDGLPLALELVAARLRLFSPQALLGRLEHRLAVLVNGPVDLPERQQTVRAALAWSYDLLPEATRRVFRMLAAFADGCTLSAVEAVCHALAGEEKDGEDTCSTAACLAGLAEHHLIIVTNSLTPPLPAPSLIPTPLRTPPLDDDGECEPRISLLQTFREYATELLGANDDEARAVARAHALYYAAFIEGAGPALKGPAQARWLRRIDCEYPNLLAALRWAVRTADLALGPRLGAALGPYWFMRGRFAEGREWLDRLLALTADAAREESEKELAPPLRERRIRVLNQAAKLATRQGDYAHAAALLDEGLCLARQHAEPQLLATLLNSRGIVASNQGRYREAQAAYMEALALSRRLGDQHAVSAHLGNLANIAAQVGDDDTATTLYEEALAIDRALGDTRAIAAGLTDWGVVLTRQGAFQRAEQSLLESLALRHALEEPWGIGHVLLRLVELAIARGQYEQATAYLAESAPWLERTGDPEASAHRLRCLGQIAHASGQLDEAEGYFAESLARYRALRRAQDGALVLTHLSALARDRGEVDRALSRCHEALRAYRKLGLDGEIARCLDTAAALAHHAGRPERAKRLETLAAQVRCGPAERRRPLG